MTNPTELPPIPVDTSDFSTPQPGLDRIALGFLTRRAGELQVYFGRGFELTAQDRVQLDLVVTEATTALEPFYADPNWAIFQALVAEGADKGVLVSFSSHKGTNVPTWCVKGAESTPVRKIRTPEGGAAIEVPPKVFNLYHWKNTVESIRRYAATSNETLYGRSSKPLGRDLAQVSHLLTQHENK